MPLSGIRVVEVGSLPAAAYAARLLADFGAEVIKIEPPGGDLGRQTEPRIDIGGGNRESAWFGYLNFGKSSVVLGPKDADRLSALIDAADICIDGQSVDWAGLLAAKRVAAIAAGRIQADLSWFGRIGPYAGFQGSDAVCRALAGMTRLVGPIDGAPVNSPDYHAAFIGGLAGATAILAALHARGASGGGRAMEISVHEACIALVDLPAAESFTNGSGYRRAGINRFPPTFPCGIYPTGDGWLGVTLVTPAQWRGFCALLGLDDLAADENLLLSTERILRAEEIEDRIRPELAKKSAGEWFQLGLQYRLPLVELPTMEEAIASETFRAREAIVSIHHGERIVEAPSAPMHLKRTPPRRGGTVPALGAGAAEFTATPLPRLAVTGARPPLAGMRVIDLSMGWAGPLCTRHLADLGADVIKIEACRYMDWWRGTDTRAPALEARLYEKTGRFNALNRNKRGITLDLTSLDGVRLLKALVATADAVVENYSTGVLPKLGLDYSELKKVNPSIVMASMSAFGATGPWRECRAYGSTLEQGSGLPLLVGRPGDPPVMGNSAYGDAIGGYNAAVSVLTALLHRQRTGEGQHIDLSQVECMLAMTAPWMIVQSATGAVPPRDGNRHPGFLPQGVFSCAGDDEWLMVTVADDAMWSRLAHVINRADLADLRDRARHLPEIEAAIAVWTRTRNADAAMAELQRAEIAAGVVRSPYELLADPHLIARGFYRMVDRPFSGRHPQPAAAFRENGAPYPVRWPSPTLGQFNAEVLTTVLGLTQAEIANLAADGVIGSEAVAT